jgi:histidyl-tRNA synthetase
MIQRPRGTEDVYGERAQKFRYIENKIFDVVKNYGYEEIRTPMFEPIETFVRSVGETSDIVKKEFYNFLDKGGREIALRPEGTAPVIRAVVENKLHFSNQLPLKYWYKGPMFRYERQQKGRYRQLNQFGCEIIGTNSIYDDVDCLIMCNRILESIGIKDHLIKINNLGSFESREK